MSQIQGFDSLHQLSYTATTRTVCKHRNGWYVTIKFWIFSKRVFVCSDCGSATPAAGRTET